MTKTLCVYLNQDFVGLYTQDQRGRISFRYDPNYLIYAHAIPLSKALPLLDTIFDHNTCHNFFAGILPEDPQRRLIAHNLGISANNDFSLLEKIGGECAGAISLFATQQTLTNVTVKPVDTIPTPVATPVTAIAAPNTATAPATVTTDDYLELSATDLQAILADLPTKPLLAGNREVRLSLAGVQDKFTVAIIDGKIYLPLHGASSTHILKPELGYSISTVSNEALCLKLARLIGLAAADCEIASVAEHRFLLVRRYDREYLSTSNILRIHQEDFCQALSIAPEKKYQTEGGPSLKSCFALIRETSSMPIYDIPALLDAVIYNYIIGNCDAHGKNFSLLYREPSSTRLAPLYDLLCTVAYPTLSTNMAMKIGSEYAINQISAQHFIKFATAVGLNKTLVIDKIVELASKVVANVDKVKLYADQVNHSDDSIIHVKNLIAARARKIAAF